MGPAHTLVGGLAPSLAPSALGSLRARLLYACPGICNAMALSGAVSSPSARSEVGPSPGGIRSQLAPRTLKWDEPSCRWPQPETGTDRWGRSCPLPWRRPCGPGVHCSLSACSSRLGHGCPGSGQETPCPRSPAPVGLGGPLSVCLAPAQMPWGWSHDQVRWEVGTGVAAREPCLFSPVPPDQAGNRNLGSRGFPQPYSFAIDFH